MARFFASPAFTIPDDALAVTVDSTSTLVTGGTLDWIGRPSVKRRADGALILVYYRATGHANNDGAIYIRFSDDNGATWTSENTQLVGDGGAAVGLFPLNPTVSAGQDAFEPWLVATPEPDEFLLHTWRYNHPTENGGTYQWRTTDGGVTWTSEGGPIVWGGLSSIANAKTYATDEDMVIGSTIYVGGRVYLDADQDPSATIFCASTDKGVSWSRIGDMVGFTELSSHGTQEFGFTYLGSSRILAVVRDTAAITHTYTQSSTDMGVTWTTIADATSTFGVTGRQRISHRAQLKGEANWWADPVLLMTCFEHQTPGAALDRRTCIFVSRDSGTTWDGPHYVDAADEDGGYSDMFYDADNNQWCVVYYKGDYASPADLKLARLTIDGI